MCFLFAAKVKSILAIPIIAWLMKYYKLFIFFLTFWCAGCSDKGIPTGKWFVTEVDQMPLKDCPVFDFKDDGTFELQSAGEFKEKNTGNWHQSGDTVILQFSPESPAYTDGGAEKLIVLSSGAENIAMKSYKIKYILRRKCAEE